MVCLYSSCAFWSKKSILFYPFQRANHIAYRLVYLIIAIRCICWLVGWFVSVLVLFVFIGLALAGGRRAGGRSTAQRFDPAFCSLFIYLFIYYFMLFCYYCYNKCQGLVSKVQHRVTSELILNLIALWSFTVYGPPSRSTECVSFIALLQNHKKLEWFNCLLPLQ